MDVKKGSVKWFDTQRGFGFLLTEGGAELWFHAADRRVLKGAWWKAEIEWEWIPAPTPEPQVGDSVVYLEGEDTQGRKKAALWAHMYRGLEGLLKREPLFDELKTPWGGQLYKTRAGTIVYARGGWGKIFERRVDTADFEATTVEYVAEVVNFDPGTHPEHWEKLDEVILFPRHKMWDKAWYTLNEGDHVFETEGWGRLTNDDDYASNGLYPQGRITVKIHRRVTDGLLMNVESATVLFHRDGTVRIKQERWVNDKPVLIEAPLIKQLLESIGLEVVTDERPITAKEAISANFGAFTARHRPMPDREQVILTELRERFGWEVYPPETPLAAAIVAPVGHVYSDFVADFGKKATEETKVALIGVYDPSAVEEWQEAIADGLVLRLDGSFAWGPGTSVSAVDIKRHLPAQRGDLVRITEGGHMTDRRRWELLAYARDEAGLAEFRRRFEELNAISGTGAVILIGAGGQVANLIG